MGKKLEKFILLMWKNWIIQIRHPVQTIFAILVPAVFCVIFVIIRGLSPSETEEITIFPAFNPIFQPSLQNISILAYSPNTSTIVNSIMQRTYENLNATNIELMGLKNGKLLESYLIDKPDERGVGVVFDDSFPSNNVPSQINFNIRFPAELIYKKNTIVQNWMTNYLYPLLQLAGPRERRMVFTPLPSYYHEGFLTIQQITSQSIIQQVSNQENNVNVVMCRFSYPEFVKDTLMQIMQEMFGMIMVCAFAFSAISFIKIITVEKEKQLKETMKIMGLPGWLHWTAWFTKALIFNSITAVIIVVLLKVDFYADEVPKSVIPKCDSFLLLVFLILYICAIITYCFAISSFFGKANMAAAIGGLGFFILYVPYRIIQNNYYELSLSKKLWACLMCNTAMSCGFRLIFMFESLGEGLQWNTLWRTVTPDDNISMGHICIMLIIDSIIYLLIALYVDAVAPGKYGVPKKWHFIFSCWKPEKQKISVSVGETASKVDYDLETHETEPKNLHVGIEIRNLRKVFKMKKIAVHDLSIKMFQNQITVLLGCNGAGKTTTTNMLTGMIPPTDGTAFINGYNIRTQIELVRNSFGLCPQHNILFDELTVSEHIYFYSRLKGLPRKEIKAEINKFIQLLEMENKRKKRSSALSGGMQRKLSVAVAFCGNSRVVILDEPTNAGMDPAAKKALWDFVISQKQDRTIMLTTHFMNEADLLGDRIAIMAVGKLQCCGSSVFLKKKYDSGYRLIIDKSPECNVDEITAIIDKYVPNTEIHSNIISDLTYFLNEDKSDVIKDVLKSLEDIGDEIGVRSYGISLTTLEEVFMKVSADCEEEKSSEDLKIVNPSELSVEIVREHVLTGRKLINNQIRAMFLKRFLISSRAWPLLLVQILVPVLLLVLSLLFDENVPATDLPKLEIRLDPYAKPVTILTTTDENNTYYKSAKSWLNKHKYAIKDEKTSNLTDKMLEITKHNRSRVRLGYIIGGTFKASEMTGWFNNDPFHSSPLALNFLMNTILQNNNSNYELGVSNYPLPYTLPAKLEMTEKGFGAGLQLTFNIAFCMVPISAFYVIFYIRERVCKVKHLQFVSGANIIIFWMVSYIWDWFTYIITIICLLSALIIFHKDGFKTVNDIGKLIFVLLYFGFSMLPLVYLFSFMFKSPSLGFIQVIFFGILLGSFAYMLVEILSYEDFKLTRVSNILDKIFLVVPYYVLSKSIRSLNIQYTRYENCKKVVLACVQLREVSESVCWTSICKIEPTCCNCRQNYFIWAEPGILSYMAISLIMGSIFIATLLLKEYKTCMRIGYLQQRKHRKIYPEVDDDDDVVAEKFKVMNLNYDEILEQTVVLRKLSKYYEKFRAVNGLCLVVNRYECFGLLGVNGAGKTTTFRMITGDARISSGDVYINGLNLKKHLREIYKIVGYCPQFDALFDELTARETIKIFCLLRGYTSKESVTIAQKLAIDFDFMKHLNKKVKEMSKGNKRKLSTAIALIGDPAILYLDEPTAGMNTAAKRHLWDNLSRLRDSGKCLILTSHSMEECRALCTRLAIMVNGKLKCLGSMEHLINKFSRGYTLIIKLQKLVPEQSNTESLEHFIKKNIPLAVIKEKYHQFVTYYISDVHQPLSQIFGIMENAKNRFRIENYSLSQASLEQVFLAFSKFQEIRTKRK